MRLVPPIKVKVSQTRVLELEIDYEIGIAIDKAKAIAAFDKML